MYGNREKFSMSMAIVYPDMLVWWSNLFCKSCRVKSTETIDWEGVATKHARCGANQGIYTNYVYSAQHPLILALAQIIICPTPISA